jgi:CheY-like chemotaxis protein
MSKPRVLLVEDEFLIRMTLVDALSEDGCEVIEAGTGDEALAAISGPGELALLVTDVPLPGTLNGLQLAEATRARFPGLPVVFMTGRPDLIGRRDGPANQVVVAKPYVPSDICEAARRLLRT